MRRDGSHLHRLTHNPYAGSESGCDTDPAFSPDGQRISFVRVRADSRGLGALFVMDRVGARLRTLTHFKRGSPNALAGSWSPDGQRVVLETDENGDFPLPLMDADGHHRRRITSNLTEPSGIVWGR